MTTDQPTTGDDREPDAPLSKYGDPFEPNHKFPPVEKPAESAERTLSRADMSAQLQMMRCPGCGVGATVVQRDREGFAIAAEFEEHRRGCPEDSWRRL